MTGPCYYIGDCNGVVGSHRAYSYGMNRNGLVRIVVKEGDLLTFGWVKREALVYPNNDQLEMFKPAETIP